MPLTPGISDVKANITKSWITSKLPEVSFKAQCKSTKHSPKMKRLY